ncbi:CynX/NimT family MFS transporter [Nesterenkonia populi]
MSRRGSGLPRVLLVATVLVVAANLRPAISAVGPLLEQIRADTGLSPSLLGLLGAIPVLSFGVVSPFVHTLASRWGLERSILASLILLAVGTVIRSLPPGALPGDPAASAQISLLTGTAILSIAIGVGNVLVPAVVKRDFPDRVPVMTGLYTATMAGSAALASGTAVPLSGLAGWELALGAGALLALTAAALWSLRFREPAPKTASISVAPHAAQSKAASIWSSPVAWQVTAYFALQSTIFYLLLTWYPSMLAYQGIGEAYAGWMLSLWQGVGIAASLTVGPVLQRSQDQRLVAFLICCSMAASLIGLLAAPALVPLWTLLGGFATGTMLLLALTMISLRARTPQEASRLSGMAQGVGYLCAGTGPLLAGAVFDLTGSWAPVIYGMLAAVGLLAAAGFLAGRKVHVR